MHEILLTFKNTHHALRVEKYLKSIRQRVKMIPTPFEIFSECGFSLVVYLDEESHDEMKKDEKIDYVESYLILKQGDRNTGYEKI
ncbi:MAG: DUF3343 domain-containing protein [Spirochaetales bacterium]|nr:DUF3343 domain-containing protein [Spirochaetales bacterium]